MEKDYDSSSSDETRKQSSSECSSLESSSDDDTCKQLPKRYKLPLRSDFQQSEISHQTLMKYQSKLDEYANKPSSQQLVSSSCTADLDRTHDVAKRDVLETDKLSSVYEDPPAVDELNTINKNNSHKDHRNDYNEVSSKSGDENGHSISIAQRQIQTLKSTLNEVISESRKKRQNNIGSIDEYYPSINITCQSNNENEQVLEDGNDDREHLLTSSDNDVNTDNDESESEEEKDDDRGTNEKSQKFFDRIMFVESNLTVRDVIVIITALSLDLSIPDEAKLKLAEAIKILAGKKFHNLNLSKYMMNQCFSAQEENMTYHFYCERCKKVILYSVKANEKKGNRETFCNVCKTKEKTTSSSTNYVLSLDLKYQMEQLLLNPVLRKDIFSNLEFRNVDDGTYKDVFSGSIHKTIIKETTNDGNEYMLTVNTSTDGAPLTKSGKTGFWPVQVTLNDLSPKLRFENVLLSGLLLTPTEPKSDLLNLYLEQVYVKQIEQLFEEGIEIIHEERKITLKFCTHAFIVDAVARAIVQNRIQFNGYYGCSFCYQLGEYFQTVHGVRYPVYQDGEIRTHESHMDDVDTAKCGKICNGAKGPCALQDLPFWNMVWSFPYEYLHALLLGVALIILNEWKNGDSEFKLSKAQMDFIEKRFLQITPTSEVHRLPRSGILKGAAKPKGIELKSWLVNWYSLPCLYDVLNEDALKHFSLLVKCSYTFFSTTVTNEELDQCEIDLLTFVIEYARNYGEDKITYNIHIMLHIVESVRKTGPITCNSALSFESNIHTLKKFVNGPKGMDKQMARKHLQTLVFKTGNIGQFTSSKETIKFCASLFNPVRFSKSFHCGEKIVYCGKREIKKNESGFYFIYKKCIHDGTVYHSEDYEQNKKTDNSNVQLHSGDYGKIVKIVDDNNEPYLRIRLYKIFPENPFENVTHIKKIECEESKDILISFNDVKCKVMLVNVRNGRYLCHLPNTFEIQ